MQTNRREQEHELGTYEEGAPIIDRQDRAADPDAMDRSTRQPRPDAINPGVVGDNAGVVGDADAMTSGDAEDQFFDDGAVRNP
jgi:hypothetical protein